MSIEGKEARVRVCLSGLSSGLLARPEVDFCKLLAPFG